MEQKAQAQGAPRDAAAARAQGPGTVPGLVLGAAMAVLLAGAGAAAAQDSARSGAQDPVRGASTEAAHAEHVPDQTAAEADSDDDDGDTARTPSRPDAAAARADERAILQLLNDPRRRAAVAAALADPGASPPAVAATPAPAPAPTKPAAAAPAPAPAAAPAKPAAVSLAQDSLVADLGGQLRGAGRLVAERTRSFAGLFVDMALAGKWLERELAHPASRAVFVDVAWRAVVMILIAMAVDRLVLALLRRPLRALSRQNRLVEEDAPDAGAAEAPGQAPAAPIPVVAPPPLPPSPDTLPDPGAAPFPGLVQAGPERPLDGAIPTTAPATPIMPQTALPHPDDLGVSRERAEQQAEARSRDAMHHRRTLRVLRRLPFALLRFVLRAVPLGVFLLVGNIGAPIIGDSARSELVITTLTNLYGIGRALYLLMEMLLAPGAPGVRLFNVSDGRATFLQRWWAALVSVIIVGLCIREVGHVLAMPSRASDAITRAIVLVEHVLLAVLIWQTRRAVGTALQPPKRVQRRAIGRFLGLLAHQWWIAALFFDFSLWIVWAARIRDGYSRMWALFLSTCAIVFVCRLIGVVLLGALDRAFRVGPDAALHYPNLERRVSYYYPVVRRAVTLLLFLVGTLALLQSWGFHVLGWLTGSVLGTKLIGAAGSILVTLLVGVAVWELVNTGLERQISRFSDGGQVARAVRLRTLLPILRTILFVVLAAIVTLTMLQAVGVNIAPLLAGAGIVGVAVGFGSQKLVQDFITGIFLLVENAIAVGDTVTAAGVTGTVEHLSIRTIRLRGGDGSIQIIPFSSVSTVANMSRDFAVASVSVSIAFSEDTDRVCDMMDEIGAELRTDPDFAGMTLDDFALNGVDSLGEYAVAISGTMRCSVAGRWPVQREFNRRLRRRMDKAGIALPAPRQTINVPALPFTPPAASPEGAKG
jgi:moderate conductance mechanosensitive channel